MLETSAIDRSVQPVLMVSLDVSSRESGKDRLLYCGSAVFESDLADRATHLIEGSDVVIFGNHGPLCKCPYGDHLVLSNAEEIILSAYGDTAALFDPTALPEEVLLWRGQKRIILKRE